MLRISSRRIETVEVIDVLANFPDISMESTFAMVKMNGQVVAGGDKAPKTNVHMYRKAVLVRTLLRKDVYLMWSLVHSRLRGSNCETIKAKLPRLRNHPTMLSWLR